MNVTEVRLRGLQPGGKMRAYASVTLDNEFAVHEMRVIDGPKGLFVAMPSRRLQSGEYKDIAHPITAEARRVLQSAVLEAFARASRQMAAAAGGAVESQNGNTAAASRAGAGQTGEAVAPTSDAAAPAVAPPGTAAGTAPGGSGGNPAFAVAPSGPPTAAGAAPSGGAAAAERGTVNPPRR